MKSPTTLTVTGSTRYTITKNVGEAGLVMGAAVRISATKDVPQGATRVTARQIGLIGTIRKGSKSDPNTGYRGRSVEGTITALSPLVVTTPSNVAVAVTTTPNMRIVRSSPGTFGDFATGYQVQAHLVDNSSPPVASSIRIVQEDAHQ